MSKKLKTSVIAFAVAAAIAAACAVAPVAGSACEDGQVVGFFLPDAIECS